MHLCLYNVSINNPIYDNKLTFNRQFKIYSNRYYVVLCIIYIHMYKLSWQRHYNMPEIGNVGKWCDVSTQGDDDGTFYFLWWYLFTFTWETEEEYFANVGDEKRYKVSSLDPNTPQNETNSPTQKMPPTLDSI